MTSEEIKELKKRNKELEDGFKSATDELCEYATKIDKAIEYIKENEFYLDYKTGACIKGVMPLLEILGDKE